MTHQILDRVQETTASTGTGALALAGATTRMIDFASAGCVTGDTFWALIESQVAAEWEISFCTFAAGTPNTFTRASPLKSSAGGAAVSFSAGTKTVSLIDPAPKKFNNAGAVGAQTYNLPSNILKLRHMFSLVVAQPYNVQAPAGMSLYFNGMLAPTGKISASDIGSSLTLIAESSTLWIAESSSGAWTLS